MGEGGGTDGWGGDGTPIWPTGSMPICLMADRKVLPSSQMGGWEGGVPIWPGGSPIWLTGGYPSQSGWGYTSIWLTGGGTPICLTRGRCDHLADGGTTIQLTGGNPSVRWGIPHLPMGGTLIRPTGGLPPSGLWRYSNVADRVGGCPSQDWMEVPPQPGLAGGNPWPGLDGATPRPP